MFKEFAERSPLDIARDSIENRCPPEPDILCRFSDGENVAFELKELCSEPTAETIAYLLKTEDQAGKYIREPDLSELIRKSLRRQYETEHAVELLFYLDGRSARAPDTLMLDIQAFCDASCHQYRRVWFMGMADEPCECVFSVEDSS